MNDKKTSILSAVEHLTKNYDDEELFLPRSKKELPDRSAVVD